MHETRKFDDNSSRLKLYANFLHVAFLVLTAVAAISVMALSQTGSVSSNTRIAKPELRTAPPPQSSASSVEGDVAAGETLFTGRRRFQNGGPPCATCHNVATLPFPSGGTMAFAKYLKRRRRPFCHRRALRYSELYGLALLEGQKAPQHLPQARCACWPTLQVRASRGMH